MVQDIGLCLHHDPERPLRALEVRDEDFDRRGRQATPDLGDAAGEGFGTAIRKIVAVNRGDHDVLQAHPRDRLGQPDRLERVESFRGTV